MTPQEQKEVERLCKLVATETDASKFDEYLAQLNELLEAKQARLKPKQQ